MVITSVGYNCPGLFTRQTESAIHRADGNVQRLFRLGSNGRLLRDCVICLVWKMAVLYEQDTLCRMAR